MSTKDTHFQRNCVICGDTLTGSDDGVMVFDCLVDQVAEIDSGKADFTDPGCTLCGEYCSLEEARTIIAAGRPPLLDSHLRSDNFQTDF
jgi:hypothetical protein